MFRRPPEETFGSFGGLRTAAAEQRRRCTEVEARERTIMLSESGEVYFGDQHTLSLTHYSMSQLAAMIRVPMPILARLQPETRASVLYQCFPRGKPMKVGLIDGRLLRAVTSDRCERVWDEELYDALDRWLLSSGFISAVPTMRHTGGKSALFRSDRDSFAFFYSEDTPSDSFGVLRKGVVDYNSEVGAKCLGYGTFLFRDMCSNMLIWGAQGVEERKARHTSGVRDLFRDFDRELRTISNQLLPEEYAVIEKAARTPFTRDGSPDEAGKRLQREFGIPKALAPEVLKAVHLPENPGEMTVWGVVNGITSVAKGMAYAEGKTQLASVAGELLANAK